MGLKKTPLLAPTTPLHTVTNNNPLFSSCPFRVQAGLKEAVTKSRKQIKEKKNRVKKLRGGAKVSVSSAAVPRPRMSLSKASPDSLLLFMCRVLVVGVCVSATQALSSTFITSPRAKSDVSLSLLSRNLTEQGYVNWSGGVFLLGCGEPYSVRRTLVVFFARDCPNFSLVWFFGNEKCSLS